MTMWYFAWVLGLGLACAFAILNAMWLELDPRLTYDPYAKVDEPIVSSPPTEPPA
jgi:cyd operon protein YbgT